jgi:hypothetical protein
MSGAAILTVDAYKLPRLRALEQRLRALVSRGDHDQASICADLILDWIGLRPFKLGEPV